MWLAGDELDPVGVAEALPLLDAGERERHGRFHFEHDRVRYLSAHALLRRTLSRYAGVDPSGWAFEIAPGGRPELAPFAGWPPLRFNLSHTRGLVACAVTVNLDVGVDVEQLRATRDLQGMARDVMSDTELGVFQALDGHARVHRFYECWTAKEAYVKARGDGLRLPVRSIGVETGPSPSLVLGADLADDQAQWQLECSTPTDGHCLAVALRHGRASRRNVVVRWSQP